MFDQRATIAEIDLKAVASNVSRIAEKVAPAEIMAVVKADAYGLGAVPIARQVLRSGVSQLAVALVDEGIELRKHRIEAPILVFGGLFASTIDSFLEYDLQMTLYDVSLAEEVSRRALALGKKAKAHVKIDTGMGRVGFFEDSVANARRLAELEGLELNGIYTHFASSDIADKSFAHIQLRRFRQVIDQLRREGIEFRHIHAANSAAILDLPDSYFNLVRPGISVYGYFPGEQTSESIELVPALKLKTKVLFVKQVPPDFPVSYGSTFRTQRRSHIATLPVGYADGYRRKLSNDIDVLVKGERYPVAGRVCMDQIMIDLGESTHVEVGDEVTLLGRDENDEISIFEWCRKLDTIPYEVTCGISKRVPRVYLGE